LEFGAALPPRAAPLPAHGGRSADARDEFCAGGFAGRSEPNPCGARPRSELLPWASQTRELLPARCEDVPEGVFPDRFAFGAVEGGRFCESSRWRAVMPELAGALPGRFSTPALALTEPLTEELPVRAFAPPFAVARELPTGDCAPAAGAVRAITERF